MIRGTRPHCTSPVLKSSLSRTARGFTRVVQSISNSTKLYPSCFPILYPVYLEQRIALSELFPFLVRRVVGSCVSLMRRAVRFVCGVLVVSYLLYQGLADRGLVASVCVGGSESSSALLLDLAVGASRCLCDGW